MKIEMNTSEEAPETILAIGKVLVGVAEGRMAETERAWKEASVSPEPTVTSPDHSSLGTGGVPLLLDGLFHEFRGVAPVELRPEDMLVSPAPPPPGVELDSAGMPWDGRIHSQGRSKIMDGTWRLKRGASAELTDSVSAELASAALVPTPPPPVPAPPGVPAEAGMTFATLLQHITLATTSGAKSHGEIAKSLHDAGLPPIPALISRPDLIGGAARALGFAS